MYIKSKYMLEYNKGGEFLLFNSYSGSICVLSNEEYERYQDYSNGTNDIQNPFVVSLYKLGFLIDSDKDETNLLNLMRVKNSVQTKNLFFRILPTTKCNARCFYCYEEGIVYENMDKINIPKVIEFILTCIKENTEQVTIQWYGGEPLLEINLIKEMTLLLKKEFINRNIRYTFTMISNGILLSPSITKKLREELEISKVQITLDGTNEIYKKRKAYMFKIENPFQKIIESIDLLKQNKIIVHIRINCDGDNYEDILELINYLGLKYSNDKYIRVYAYPLYGSYRTKKLESSSSNIIDKKEYFKIVKSLIDNHLLEIPNLKVKKNSCGATHVNSFFILPNGDLVKCMMNTDEKVGDIFKGVKFNYNYFKWCDFTIPKNCLSCKLLPLCQGGCRAGHFGYTQNRCFVYKDIIPDLLFLLHDKLNCID